MEAVSALSAPLTLSGQELNFDCRDYVFSRTTALPRFLAEIMRLVARVLLHAQRVGRRTAQAAGASDAGSAPSTPILRTFSSHRSHTTRAPASPIQHPAPSDLRHCDARHRSNAPATPRSRFARQGRGLSRRTHALRCTRASTVGSSGCGARQHSIVLLIAVCSAGTRRAADRRHRLRPDAGTVRGARRDRAVSIDTHVVGRGRDKSKP